MYINRSVNDIYTNKKPSLLKAFHDQLGFCGNYVPGFSAILDWIGWICLDIEF